MDRLPVELVLGVSLAMGYMSGRVRKLSSRLIKHACEVVDFLFRQCWCEVS